MSRSLKWVKRAMEAYGIDPQIIEFPGTTATSRQAAEAIGCQVGQIAKSVILVGLTTNRHFLFLTSGINRVDLDKAGMLIGESAKPANAQFIRRRTGFVIGSVAPFGHLEAAPTYIDTGLMKFERVWTAAGTPRHVFDISPTELQRITGAEVADFAE